MQISLKGCCEEMTADGILGPLPYNGGLKEIKGVWKCVWEDVENDQKCYLLERALW